MTKPKASDGVITEDSEYVAYLPTPEEIREECKRIQAGWTREELAIRSGKRRALPMSVRVVGDPKLWERSE